MEPPLSALPARTSASGVSVRPATPRVSGKTTPALSRLLRALARERVRSAFRTPLPPGATMGLRSSVVQMVGGRQLAVLVLAFVATAFACHVAQGVPFPIARCAARGIRGLAWVLGVVPVLSNALRMVPATLPVPATLLVRGRRLGILVMTGTPVRLGITALRSLVTGLVILEARRTHPQFAMMNVTALLGITALVPGAVTTRPICQSVPRATKGRGRAPTRLVSL